MEKSPDASISEHRNLIPLRASLFWRVDATPGREAEEVAFVCAFG